LKEGFKYFKLSADKGNSFAQYDVGICYYHGKGVDHDPKEAFKYFNLSAKQRNKKTILFLRSKELYEFATKVFIIQLLINKSFTHVQINFFTLLTNFSY
jgi:hypothetical protein